MVVSIPCVTLNTGHPMPMLGFGTGFSTDPSRTPEHLPATILHAECLGYHHLDTASFYGTEHAICVAASEAMRSSFVASHADLFITSKLWITDARPDRVVPVLLESLARIVLDYLDLFLVHWPVAVDGDKNILPFDMEGVCRGRRSAIAWASLGRSASATSLRPR
jgi:3''-deamino-3''-oxonicotianamine reductase